jgi:hypothetical protein
MLQGGHKCKFEPNLQLVTSLEEMKMYIIAAEFSLLGMLLEFKVTSHIQKINCTYYRCKYCSSDHHRARLVARNTYVSPCASDMKRAML